MTDKDAFSDRRRALEEGYFRQKDEELIERLRNRVRDEIERRKIGRTIGVADEEILSDLQELGYTRDTLSLLHLVPLVQVAWAEGRVTGKEKSLIFEAARLRGIERDDPAFQRLQDWLHRRPPEAFFKKTLKIIGALLEALPPDKRKTDKQDLEAQCARVAEASGSILGRVGLASNICEEEQELLKRIAADIQHGRETLKLRFTHPDD